MRLAQGQVRPVVADRAAAASTELLTDPDTAKAQRVMGAMLQMRKIEIAELERAAEGQPVR